MIYFSSTDPIWEAVHIAEEYPDDVRQINTRQGVDTLVVGERALLTQEHLGNSNSFICKTFLLLGEAALGQINITAKTIIVANKIQCIGKVRIKATEVLVDIESSYEGDLNVVATNTVNKTTHLHESRTESLKSMLNEDDLNRLKSLTPTVFREG